jgi:DNA-binding CsgD family transcriptional regulator
MGACEFRADTAPAKMHDRVLVQALGPIAFRYQSPRTRLDAESPVGAAGTGHLGNPAVGSGGCLGHPAAGGCLHEFGRGPIGDSRIVHVRVLLAVEGLLGGAHSLGIAAEAVVEHALDLLAKGDRTGYLLKSRVTDVTEFVQTLQRVIRGGSAVDPALVQELVAARRPDNPLDELTGREREVLALMAEGRSNAGIGQALFVTEGTVEKHVRAILMKLRLPDSAENHRRVLAVLAFLDAS